MATKTKGGNGTSLARWDQKLADLAKQSKKAAAAIGGGGNFISLKGGHLSFQGAVIPGDKMKVVIVDWILHNVIFEGAYDEEAIQAPVCYAFGRTKEELHPDPELVAEPFNSTCSGCPKNEWGSADVGRGKACAETARLALIAEKDFGEIESAEEAYLKVPVTSMAFWGGYVRELEAVYHRPPLAFITEVSIVPQQKQPGWHLEFKMVEAIDDEDTFTGLMKKYDVISSKIAFGYPKMEEATAKPAPAKKPLAGRRR